MPFLSVSAIAPPRTASQVEAAWPFKGRGARAARADSAYCRARTANVARVVDLGRAREPFARTRAFLMLEALVKVLICREVAVEQVVVVLEDVHAHALVVEHDEDRLPHGAPPAAPSAVMGTDPEPPVHPHAYAVATARFGA